MVTLSKKSWEHVFRFISHPGRSSEGVTRRLKPFAKTMKHELPLRRSESGEEIGGQMCQEVRLGASLTKVDSLCDSLAEEG